MAHNGPQPIRLLLKWYYFSLQMHGSSPILAGVSLRVHGSIAKVGRTNCFIAERNPGLAQNVIRCESTKNIDD